MAVFRIEKMDSLFLFIFAADILTSDDKSGCLAKRQPLRYARSLIVIIFWKTKRLFNRFAKCCVTVPVNSMANMVPSPTPAIPSRNNNEKTTLNPTQTASNPVFICFTVSPKCSDISRTNKSNGRAGKRQFSIRLIPSDNMKNPVKKKTIRKGMFAAMPEKSNSKKSSK